VAFAKGVEIADPFAGIIRAVEEGAPDLLVIGPHRRQALRDVFVGTTAERTIRSVTCPLLMVNAPPFGPYGHVMLATDMSEGAERAAKACAGLGIAGDADISVLHVFDAPAVHLTMSHTMAAGEKQTYIEGQRKEASRSLSAFVKSVGWRSTRQVVRQVQATRAEEILTAASEETADLIVVGTHGRSGVARFSIGSVAEEVLRKADRDVLAVPMAAP